ncbi:DNA glycosylase [Lepidopterella palustris CBS 459.81]|uniref:DNA glycosylase n=1 Tax=Lepidopterella palustris CBS 459.81 TaxID=1314670 RepID=A0A8E2EJ95_9PEZI|nr:DNA glycosylase [Lepidopterella palustris CBS 459.81]
MARTRSGKLVVKEEAVAETATFASTSLQDDDADQGPPPTFNGALRKFQYSTTTIQNSTANSTPLLPRVPKRALQQTSNNASVKLEAASISTRPSKKQRKSSKYADPSKYAHLSPLTDILEPNLICVFVGTNPGVQTATAGHAYAHPSNHFWKLLHSSGLTDRRLKPEEDVDLPRLYCMGNTNIVDRPSKDAAELSKEEMAAGTANLDAKFLKYKPEAVCIVGKGIWEAVWRYRYGRNMSRSEFKYGWQDEEQNMGKGEVEVLDDNGNIWRGARVFVTTTTSGLAASLKPAEKEAIWKPFGDWVQKRRTERGFVAEPSKATN